MKKILALLLALLTAPAWGANYYVWNGGSSAADCGDQTGGFTAACTSFLDLFNSGIGTSGAPLTGSDTIYVAADHDDSGAPYAASFTLYGPATGAPARIISVERSGSTYQTGSTDQIDTRDGAYAISMDGSFGIWGIRMDSGGDIVLLNDNTEAMYCEDCYLKPGAAGRVKGDNYARIILVNTTISGVNDTGSTTEALLTGETSNVGVAVEMRGGAFVSTSNRTYALIGDDGSNPSAYDISGVDFSAHTTTTTEIFSGAVLRAVANNCLTATGQSFYPISNTHSHFAEILYTNVGDSDRPWWLYHWTKAGYVEAQTTVTRDDGASIGGQRVAWLFTEDEASDGFPYFSPWIYGSVSSTGSKTFTIHVANATDDLTDREAAIECQYPSTSGEAIWGRVTDRAAITATGTAQADDAVSDWDTDLTYMQKLGVTATVNQAGQFRCRVVANTTQAFYIDPKVVVE